jgi:hypothetical protein
MPSLDRPWLRAPILLAGLMLISIVSVRSAGAAPKHAEKGDKSRPPLLSGGEGEGAVEQLFDGKDLAGWKAIGKPGENAADSWSVKDGVIHCSGKPGGYLRTEGTYKDFILKLQYRWTTKQGNGGILLRMQGPDTLWPPCIQAQLQNHNTGDLILMGGAKGTIAPDRLKKNTKEPQQAKLADYNDKPAGEWNTYEIKVVGDMVQIKVNGVLQNEMVGLDQVRGHIGFQSEGTEIDFRKIDLTPLTSEGGMWQRLPGLVGWHVIGHGTWTYHDGIIEGQQTQATKTYTHVVSDQRYHNLRATLQYKCLDGNSGFYFRAQPTDKGLMMGIQCEIDVVRDAGGFYESYGRQWLSKPKAEDVARYYKQKQWNEMKIEAIGDHVTAWINGTKAAEINDPEQRKEGVCALQIHGGQNVHVLFKDIKIERLPD